MKLITRDTDYALRALCVLGKKKNEVIAVSSLVRELKIPRPFLRKILQRLHRRGILRAQRGKDGGFQLAKPAEALSLLGLVRVFQKDFRLNECNFKKKPFLRKDRCPLRRKIEEIEQGVFMRLQKTKVGSLLKEARDA